MPFIGRDWRSPGDQWVKTNEGWERMRTWRLKLFGNLNENIVARILKLSLLEDFQCGKKYDYEQPPNPQPHIHLLRGLSREQKVQTNINEALIKLDMSRAVKDIQRFNYICQLVDILLQEKLMTLSGAAQKALFNILENLVEHCVKTESNPMLLSNLVLEAEKALEKGVYTHIGSSSLWQNHLESVDKMKRSIKQMKIKERTQNDGLYLQDLPDEIICHILRCLTNHIDIINTSLTRHRLYSLATEQLLWRELCFYHFTNAQVHKTVTMVTKDTSNLSWKEVYKKIRKRYAKKQTYADMIYLCKNCNALYWKESGHPCYDRDSPSNSVEITPHKFITLFNHY